MNQSIALNVRTPQPDLAEITRSAQAANLNDYQMRNAPLKSELEGLQLQGEIGEQHAMQEFKGASAKGDPNALDKLSGQPGLQKQMFEAFDGMSPQEFMEAKKRSTAFRKAAQFVGARVDGTPEQEQRWNASAKVLKDAGYIDDARFRMMIEAGPSELLLQQALTTDEWVKAYAGKNANSLDDELTRARIADISADNERADRKVEPGPKPPAGYRSKDDGSLEFIPGGPADPTMKGAKNARLSPMPAELAARIGLAKDFGDQFPRLVEEIQGGVFGEPEVTAGMENIGKRRDMVLRRGKQGEILREIKGGSEALTRMLTGAGMNMAEATNEVQQYLPEASDTSATIIQKITMLNRRLDRMVKEASAGRVTAGAPVQGEAEGAQAAPEETGEAPAELSEDEATSLIQQALEAVEQGEDRAAVLQELLDMGVDPSLAAEGLSQ